MLSSGIGPPLTLDLQNMEHIGGAVGNDVGPERVISSDPNFQRVIAVAFLPKAFGRGPL